MEIPESAYYYKSGVTLLEKDRGVYIAGAVEEISLVYPSCSTGRL